MYMSWVSSEIGMADSLADSYVRKGKMCKLCSLCG